MEDAKSEEAIALWTEVFGEPPPVRHDFDLMMQLIFEATTPADYEGLERPKRQPSPNRHTP